MNQPEQDPTSSSAVFGLVALKRLDPEFSAAEKKWASEARLQANLLELRAAHLNQLATVFRKAAMDADRLVEQLEKEKEA